MNFDSVVLFGEEIPDLTNTANRKLNTKYPKKIKKYSDEVKSKFERRGLFKNLAKLHAKFRKTGPTIKLIKNKIQYTTRQ